MSRGNKLILGEVNPNINNSRNNKNKLPDTINMIQRNSKYSSSLNDNHLNQGHFYQTIDKVTQAKEIKLMNKVKDKEKDYDIILLKRNNKEPVLQSNNIPKKIKYQNETVKLNDIELNEQCNLESSINSRKSKQCNSVVNFQAKFIEELYESSFMIHRNPDEDYYISNPFKKKSINANKILMDNMHSDNDNDKDKDKKKDKEKEQKTLGNRETCCSNEHYYIQSSQNCKLNETQKTINQIGSNQSLSDKKEEGINKQNSRNVINSTDKKNRTISLDFQALNNERPKDKIINSSKILAVESIKEEDKQYETEFTFSLNQARRYKAKNIISQKDFFQMRYLNQNLRNIPKLADISTKNNHFLPDNPKHYYFYIDNRNVIKYISLFYKKIEASIFHFNAYQFETSYYYLLDDSIIYKLDEFGEILLLIQGFNKEIIGEFLSNENPPNEKYCVTQGLISKLDFRKEDFLPCFRFFLTLFILPKDNEEVLLEFFSTCYFNDNLDKSNLYKNRNYVKSLCYLTLNANTVMKRQSKGLSREQFITHYPNIDIEMSGYIYDEIKKVRILEQDNYNEEIYNKLYNKSNGDNVNNQTKQIVKISKNQLSLSRNSIQKQLNSQISITDLISILKRGEIFRQKKQNGSNLDITVNLNKDEKSLIFKKIGCSLSLPVQKRISITEIINIYLGSPSIRNNDHENYLTIITKNSTLELYNSNKKTILKWFNGISHVMKSNQALIDNKHNILNQNNNKDFLSIYWLEIVNNWAEYRDVLKFKDKKSNYFSKSNGKQIHSLNQNNKMLKISKDDAIALWGLGLPNWIRNSLWKIILNDKLDICENLLSSYQNTMEEEVISSQTNTKTAKMIKDLMNDINVDITELYQKYKSYTTIKEEIFKEQLYILIRGFCLYRPDILYSNQIAYIAMIFYLNSTNYFEAFVFLCNFIIPNCFFKFTLEDEVFLNEYTTFFDILLRKYLLNIHKHFHKFGVNLKIFFLNWVGYLFATTFEYETVLRIFDNFLLKGNIFIFEVALAIISVQEKDLLNSSINDLFNNLKYFQKKYSEKELFDSINSLNISELFQQHFEEFEIGKEKGAICKSYLN